MLSVVTSPSSDLLPSGVVTLPTASDTSLPPPSTWPSRITSRSFSLSTARKPNSESSLPRKSLPVPPPEEPPTPLFTLLSTSEPSSELILERKRSTTVWWTALRRPSRPTVSCLFTTELDLPPLELLSTVEPNSVFKIFSRPSTLTKRISPPSVLPPNSPSPRLPSPHLELSPTHSTPCNVVSRLKPPSLRTNNCTAVWPNASERSSRTKDPVDSSREPSPTSFVEPVPLSCWLSTTKLSTMSPNKQTIH
mmetsp:Transcript_13848/g.28579  ORF Transcript_13848/g.28579 Transcript_13848/m.28579 type:complete len:250 (-) Transcript_13848:70-819(-)